MYLTDLFACLHIVVHSLDGPENLLVPEQIIAGAKHPHVQVVMCGRRGIGLWPLHPPVLQDRRHGDALRGVKVQHATNQLLTLWNNNGHKV